MLNHIVVQGRLGKNPEKRALPSGKSVTTFSLAVDRDFKNKDTGERETDWIDIVCFGNLADMVATWFTRGRMAVVSGRLQIRPWTDKEGNKRRSAEIVADNVYFGDSKKESSGPAAGGYTAPPAPAAAAPTENYQQTQMQQSFEEITDDDSQLPF